MGKKSKLKKRAVRLGTLDQVAALPYRVLNGDVEFLVITSRRRKRLIVPKGWPMPGKPDADVAAIEADEEAGVKGTIAVQAIGSFKYLKSVGSVVIPVTAAVFPLRVKKIKSEWKERRERKRKWLSADEASSQLDDDGLSLLVKAYAGSLELSAPERRRLEP